MKKISDFNLHRQRVLIREDFNVPIQNGVITDDTRIQSAIPTIQFSLKQQARVILVSHLGRPKEGEYDDALSLKPVAQKLSELLNKPVPLIAHWIDGVSVEPGEVVLCENVRFLVGEKKCDDVLSKKMADLCDIFVMDAFATAHRSAASTVGIAKYAKQVCAGPLLEAELTALSKALTHPTKPVAAIVGGAKVSTKLQVLENLLEKVDSLILGGGIANTFLAAKNFPVGKSLCEMDYVPMAKKLLEKATSKKIAMPLPIDVVVAKAFSAEAIATVKLVEEVASDDMILDVGPKTIAKYVVLLNTAKTIVWNGPVGVFEFPAFADGTKRLAEAIAKSTAFSVVGGGDTIAAITQCHVRDKISYISTGGGAFLEWMEGKVLPGVQVLYAHRTSH